MQKILIDGNSVGFAANGGAKLSAGEQATQAIFGTINTMRGIIEQSTDGSVIFLWDGYSWRKKVCADYKGQRSKTAKQRESRAEYKSQGPIIRRAMKTLGIPQVSAANLEADDLAAIFSQRFVSRGHKVRLVTRDKDWLQLVQSGVTWQDHCSGELVTHRSFEKFTGFKHQFQFVQHKAMTGDVSDNIKGIGGVGDVAASHIIRVWGDVESFLADDEREAVWLKTMGKKCPKAVSEFIPGSERDKKYRENLRLMDLCSGLPDPVDLKVIKGEFDPEAFRKLCLECGFMSILNDFDRFIVPFETLAEE